MNSVQATGAADRLAGFDQFVAERMKEWKVPGVAISIVRDGRVIYARGFGFRDVEKQLPVTPDTLFAIGSATKAFGATGLGILVNEGKLEWDRPLVNYLPDFRLSDPYVTANVTPRDLVTHRTGLPRHDTLLYGSPFSHRELYGRLRHLELSHGLRERYQYHNMMYMTVGILIEAITGAPWEQFTRERLFAPLEMRTSNFSVTESQKAADFALPYDEVQGEVKRVPFRNIDTEGPAGAINSSVNEMANWVIANLGKGRFREEQVIPEAAFLEPHTPQVVIRGPMQYDEISYGTYGMGWIIDSYRGHLRLSHGGGIDGFATLVRMLPRKNIGCVILSQVEGTPLRSVLANTLIDRLLGLESINWNQRARAELEQRRREQDLRRAQPEKDRKEGTRTSRPLADYVGKYEHPGYGVVSITKEGETLKLKYYNDSSMSMELRHYHFDIFEESADRPVRRKVSFSLNEREEVDRVAVPMEPAVKDIVFRRVVESRSP